jgi:hypothetical protein
LNKPRKVGRARNDLGNKISFRVIVDDGVWRCQALGDLIPASD